MDASSVQYNWSGYLANDANIQHERSVHEQDQFMEEDSTLSQGLFFQQHSGTSAGSVIPQQSFDTLQHQGTSAGSVTPEQSIGMASQHSMSPRPSMGYSHSMAQNQFMQGPLTYEQYYRVLSELQVNYGASMSQQQQVPAQQHSLEQMMYDSMSLYRNNPGVQNNMAQQQFDDEFNDPHVDTRYGNNFEASLGGTMNNSPGPSYGNSAQPQPQPSYGVGYQFEGGQAAVCNHYQQQQQQQQQQQHQDIPSNLYNTQQHQNLLLNLYSQHATLNPYNQQHQQQDCLPNIYEQFQQQQQQQQDVYHEPMHEVGVQNNSTQGGAASDNVPQFNDAFLW